VYHASGSGTGVSPDHAWLNAVNGWFEAGGRRRAWLARVLFILIFALLFASTGCEVLTYHRTDFPAELTGAEGQDIIMDQITPILNDANLDNDAKRQALRDLGIEDEDLLDVLLGG
jgi:hypothetical protein